MANGSSSLLAGGVVAITGGTRGIGRATAIAAADAGAKVVIGGRCGASGGETEAAIIAAGGEACYLPLDVTDRDSIRHFVAGGVDCYGRVDAFVNNAAISGTSKPLHLRADEEDELIFAVNLVGLYHCLKEELPVLLRQGGGAIVNLGSVGSQVGMAGISSYVATKHGVLGLTRTAALEYASRNIRVNCVCPSGVPTAMARALLGEDAAVLAPVAAAHPLGWGEPEEIAAAILFLLSGAASYITGQSLVVDGGLIAGSGLPWQPGTALGPALARQPWVKCGTPTRRK